MSMTLDCVDLPVVLGGGSGSVSVGKSGSRLRKVLLLSIRGGSFIWNRKSSGPRTVPCGTPESTVADVTCNLN